MTKAPCSIAFIFYKLLLYALAELILTTLGGETTFLATNHIWKLRLRMMVICPCSSLELAEMIHWGLGVHALQENNLTSFIITTPVPHTHTETPVGAHACVRDTV